MLRKYGLYAVWLISTIATLSSLYLTEIQHWTPCRICWYQQICMYPLAIITGIAAWRGFYGIAEYVIPQALIGLFLTLYEVFVTFQKPLLAVTKPIEICTTGSGCPEKIELSLNLSTILYLSTASFLFITIILFSIKYIAKKETPKTN